MEGYGYCRVSTVRQARDGDSLDVQRRQIEGCALTHGLELSPKLDRLFRGALDALNVIEGLKARGVSLRLIDVGGDVSGNGMAKIFLRVTALFAEIERDRIRERISRVKADQRKRGRFLGGLVPFGWRRGEGGELRAHEGEQAAIREIVAMRASGATPRAISAALKGRGHALSHEGVASVLRARA
jgi:DNA invertase Pin-like site-specific DNA recombinase